MDKVLGKFIVAEVSKTWTNETPGDNLLANKFEQVINVNHDRGYILKDWKAFSSFNDTQLTETIIAIFEKQP